MGQPFASGRIAIAVCDRCGVIFKLKKLQSETVKLQPISNRVCPECWDPDHPQLQLGMYPVNDPQALRTSRKDTSYLASGLNSNGNLSGGSRELQWGWAPVGGARATNYSATPNALVTRCLVGTVTVTVT